MLSHTQLILAELPFEVPSNCVKVKFDTNLGELILREPLAYDFRCLEEETKELDNKYDRFFIIANRLGVSIKGKPVTMNDIALLDSASFEKVISWTAEVYSKLIPVLSQETMEKLGMLDNIG